MTEKKFYSPLKIGFLTVALAYFLFTFHAMFTLSWIGEWESFSGSFRFVIFVEDISATIGIAFRLVASTIAFAGAILYFVKKGLSTQRTMKVLTVVLIGEAIYWLGLLASGVLPLFSTEGFAMWRVDSHISTLPVLTSILINEIPLLVESISIPVVLFKLSYELNPNKPAKGAIKWGLIAGTVYILVFWLTNTALWASTVMRQGMKYLTSYPENLLSFALTTIGMLALTVFTAYFAKKSIGTEIVEKLKLKTIGAITIALGLFYLWNYLTWIFFGRDQTWSNWYEWFLGHNLNLWLLSIPLVGLPLLFEQKAPVRCGQPMIETIDD
ncbi:MAG: hypothetical protein ABSF44_00165 [Candidatus Bathyarchaeia archaeon]|jgi:hypothetical protein